MTYFDTNMKKDCNGCGVCARKCPKGAITMQEDEEGFLYPVIDKAKCINCGLCKRICPNHEYEKNENIKTYIAINNNQQELKASTSGGMFYILAKYVIAKGGIVYGVKYDENLKVIHSYITDLDKIKEFQGSKYVRSDLKNSYNEIKKFLEDGKYVLFTGTPCQCQGLKKFLNKDYSNLIICDILCHANPSPKIFELYKKNLELRKNSKISNILFRCKENGWHYAKTIIKYCDGTEEIDTNFYNGFGQELINRPSCHNCHFCTINRQSDFTIGDMWGIDKIDSTIKDNNTGISLLCVNNKRAENIFNEINHDMFFKEIKTDDAIRYNHNSNVPVNKNREKFFDGIADGTINETNIIFYLNKYTRRPFLLRVLSKVKSLIKQYCLK